MTNSKALVIYAMTAILMLMIGATMLVKSNDNNIDCLQAQSVVSSDSIEARDISFVEMDLVLYMQLMFIRDGVYPDLESDTDYIKLNSKDFVDYVSLDLSDLRIDGITMTDASGLGLFDFSNLRTLDLSNNNLTEIPKETFAGMTQLDELIVYGNSLEVLDISTLTGIKNISAKSNNLSTIDLSSLLPEAVVNLSYNNIKDFSSLNLKLDGQGAQIDLYGNKLNNFSLDNYTNYNFIIGFQQEYDLTKYDEHSIIRLYKYGKQIFWLECVNINTNQATYITSESTLTPSTYRIYLKDDSGYLDYEPITIKIYKSAPTYTILDEEGNPVDLSQDIKGAVRINFDSNDENYFVEYSINGKGYVVGDSIEINKNGTYTFTVKAVSDIGDESNSVAFTIKLSSNENGILKMLSIIFSVFILLGILLCAYTIFVNKTHSNDKKK